MEIERTEHQVNTSIGANWSIIFWTYFMINLLSNVDCGIIPAAINSIKAGFSVNQFQIGMLGSLVYSGVVCKYIFVSIVGSVLSGPFYRNMSSKTILLLFLTLNIIILVCFFYS